VLGPSYSRRSRKVWDRSFLSELNAATLQTRAVLRAPHWRSASVMRSASAAGGRDPVVSQLALPKVSIGRHMSPLGHGLPSWTGRRDFRIAADLLHTSFGQPWARGGLTFATMPVALPKVRSDATSSSPYYFGPGAAGDWRQRARPAGGNNMDLTSSCDRTAQGRSVASTLYVTPWRRLRPSRQRAEL
jgi:hypothetical protein